MFLLDYNRFQTLHSYLLKDPKEKQSRGYQRGDLIDETQGRNDEDLMFDTGVLNGDEVFQEPIVSAADPEQALASTLIVSPSQLLQAKDKGKAKMVEPKKPLKKKDQIVIDEEVARNLKAQLQADLEEEERLSIQKEEEANIALIESWDNT
ncbi:hypothetical protein Tco_0491334 [Tanacetum coccineum]